MTIGIADIIPATSDSEHFDICVICALAEEANAVIREFSHQCGVDFKQDFSSRSNREYRNAVITNNIDEPLKVQISWPPNLGPVEASLHLKATLDEFRPRFAIMIGICAGDKRKVKLGDLVVADRAFTFDSGKVVKGKDGRPTYLPDTDTRHPDPDVLQYVQMFDSWKEHLTHLPRPISKRQQREWLLCELLKEATPRIDDIEQSRLNKYAPDWKRIVKELQTGHNSYLTKNRMLRNRSKIEELHFREEEFPFMDPLQPRCHIAPIASGSAVRSDDPFKEVQLPVRKTVAIEMEGAAFYRAVADYPGVRSLLVKAVCDYADSDKDDSYHEYAATLSATYALCFIKQYVNSSRMPRLSTRTETELPGDQKHIDVPGGKVVLAPRVNQVVVDAGDKEYPRPREHVRFCASDFIGRQEELKNVVPLLKQAGAIGLYALKGMGGVGKTALAAQIATILDDENRFPGGILWANLGVETPSDIAARWLGNYGYDVSRENEQTRLVRLGSVLASSPALLILDNAQQTADVRKLLVKVTSMAILVTTRKRTAIPAGVHAIALDQMPPNEALLLLVSLVGNERVQAEQTSAEDVCMLCGYLPLALMLAGSQLGNTRRWQTIDEYKAQLEHHRMSMLSIAKEYEDNVRLAFDISYQELDDSLKPMFDSLALFNGPDFMLDAAATMMNLDDLAMDDTLETLVDLSLLMREDDKRYRLHDLLRDYATEKLALHNQDEITSQQRRLVFFYRDYTEANSTQYRKLDLERQSILGVIRFARSDNNDKCSASLVDIVRYLTEYFKVRGLWKLAVDIGEDAYNLAAKFNLTEAQADIAIRTISWVYFHQENLDIAKDWARKGLDLYEQVGSDIGRATAARRLGLTLGDAGQFDEARSLLKEALEIFRKVNALEKVADDLTALGYLERKQKNPELAQIYLDEALQIAHESGDQKEVSIALYQHGRLATARGQIKKARNFHEKSLIIDETLDRKPGIAWNLLRLGLLGLFEDEHKTEARKQLQTAMQMFEEMGVTERVSQIDQILKGNQ